MNEVAFEAVYERLPSDGWLSKNEARLLWTLAQLTAGPILEVGCYQGRSTILLASFGRPVYAVDPFANFNTEKSGDQVYRRFLDNLLDRRIYPVEGDTLFEDPWGEAPYVRVYRQRIEDWTPMPVGLAYLDGDHTYEGTIAQIQKAMACRAPDVIAVHDVNDSGGGLEVKRACLERLGPWRERVERLAYWRLDD